jgi:integrase
MPHAARRAFGTRGLEAGTPINIIQRQMRHKKPATTMNYAQYLEVDEIKRAIKLPY